MGPPHVTYPFDFLIETAVLRYIARFKRGRVSHLSQEVAFKF